MTYSCGIHTGPGQSLEAAQYAKIDAIIDAAGLGPNDSVLEIGCGWGAFAIRAAKRTGCRRGTAPLALFLPTLRKRQAPTYARGPSLHTHPPPPPPAGSRA